MTLPARVRWLVLALLAGVMTPCPGSAGVWHSEEVLYGASMEIDDPYGDSVLQIYATDALGDRRGGTAVRINDWYGLTAAHVVYNPSYGFREDIFVDPGDDHVESADAGFPNKIEIVEVGIHPEFHESLYIADVAWIKFSEPIPGPDLVIGEISLKDQLRVVGFGSPGVAGEDWRRRAAAGPRRAFDVMIDRAFPSGLHEARFLPLSERDLPYGGMASPGDSGGPGFNAAGELVSITHGVNTVGRYGSITTVVGLHTHKGFIEEFTTIRIPEPAGGALVVLALGCGGLARFREAYRSAT